jgi:glycosyltransferase involved in cell wall biosynthesis
VDSLKILLLDPHLKGGGQVRYLTNLATELTRRGHQVTIGCRPQSVLVENAHVARCAVLNEFNFRGGLRLQAWRQDLRKIRRFIAVAKPDIVHVSGSQDHWLAALANRFTRRPVCVVRTRHNTYEVKENLGNRLLNLRWTDYQIVVCDMVRRRLAAQPVFDGGRLCAIHNGVDAEAYKPDLEARHEARAALGYRPEDIVVGIAARLVHAKGHEFLFRAAAQLREAFPAMRLLVLGQGEREIFLRQLVNSLQLAKIVQFAGFRDDMARCVQAFDIGVQPSIDCDTSSFSLKEQMAAEKPVIASDFGGLTEIVTDGVEGFIVKAGTVEPLAEALRKLLNDADLRRCMGVAGRERVLKEFTVEVFAERTLEAYRTALEVHHERTASR